MARLDNAAPVRTRPARSKPCRIRSWRSDAIRTPERIAGVPAEAERLFPAREDGSSLRLARQLRRERMLGAGAGVGYDLARHAALARALAHPAADKEKAPRE
jgi:hypothetical protein